MGQGKVDAELPKGELDEVVSVKIKVALQLPYKTAHIASAWAANSGLSLGEYCEYLVKKDVVDGLA